VSMLRPFAEWLARDRAHRARIREGRQLRLREQRERRDMEPWGCETFALEPKSVTRHKGKVREVQRDLPFIDDCEAWHGESCPGGCED
jgi:hypothetical protein